MFTASVKTTHKAGDHMIFVEVDKHRAAAAKKLGADVEMVTSKTTTVPRPDNDGHDVVLETEWRVAPPIEQPATPPLPASEPHPTLVDQQQCTDAAAAAGQTHLAVGRENQ